MRYYQLKINATRATASSYLRKVNRLKLTLQDNKRIAKLESQLSGQLAEVLIEKE
jgi:hypothetical protein